MSHSSSKSLFSWVAIFVLIAAVFFAQRIIVSAQSNQAPTVQSVYISSTTGAKTDAYPSGTIDNLSPGSTLNIHVNGEVEDLDGRDDISFVSVVFRRSGASGGNSCTADNNDCYRLASCSLSNNEDSNQKDYNCMLSIAYYADSTVATTGRFPDDNWVTEVYVEDLQVASGNDTSVTKEMGEILSLDIAGSLNFGSMDMGDTSTALTNAEQTITQNGNDVADVEVNGLGSMTCDFGTIPVANHQWALTDVPYDDVASTVLSAVATDTDLAVSYRDDDTTEMSKILYWNLEIPSIDIAGACTGSIVVNAIAS